MSICEILGSSVAGQRCALPAACPAYTAELQAWITGLQKGEIVGPSAWDGYAATRVTEFGVQAVKTGQRVAIDYIDKPALYR